MYSSSKKLTHTDSSGRASMVDVSDKSPTHRTATAVGKIHMSSTAWNLIKDNQIKKGAVLTISEIAGIMGAKKTSELIPLCHNIEISKVKVNCKLSDIVGIVDVECTVSCFGKTGVEMEALVGCSTACLTVYDMCKAVDKQMRIGDIQVVEKRGGKSGDWKLE